MGEAEEEMTPEGGDEAIFWPKSIDKGEKLG
jgi:hypothetical protein